jgi:predicted transcriptional regulator of viral defense system
MGRRQALQDLRRFEGHPFRVREAERAGVPRYEIYRLRDSGELVELARGVYQTVDADPSSTTDLATVSARVPNGTICLNSALAFWDLTDEIPDRVHVAVPRGAHRPRIDFPPTRVHVFAPETFELEREQHVGEDGGRFWIYSRERTALDALRLARIVGRDQAYAAVRRYLTGPGAQPRKLAEIGERLGVGAQVRRSTELLLS